MDVEKLFKAIQIVVNEEVKKQITTLKEEIRKELINEIKSSNANRITPKKSLKNLVDESKDPFELANKILLNEREKKSYSKNPLINNILNETQIRPNFSKDDGEWGTITHDMVGYSNATANLNQNSIPMTGNDLIDKAIAKSAKVLAASKDKRR